LPNTAVLRGDTEMKEFSITVKCEDATELGEALSEFSNYVNTNLSVIDAIPVDGLIEFADNLTFFRPE
jgi:hypothetical protein